MEGHNCIQSPFSLFVHGDCQGQNVSSVVVGTRPSQHASRIMCSCPSIVLDSSQSHTHRIERTTMWTGDGLYKLLCGLIFCNRRESSAIGDKKKSSSTAITKGYDGWAIVAWALVVRPCGYGRLPRPGVPARGGLLARHLVPPGYLPLPGRAILLDFPSPRIPHPPSGHLVPAPSPGFRVRKDKEQVPLFDPFPPLHRYLLLRFVIPLFTYLIKV